MKLTEIFAQLSMGEFKQLAIGGADEGGIYAKNQHEVIQHLNLGLEDLFKRFTLRWRKMVLPLVPGTTDYVLAPTSKDLLKVIAVFDQAGEEMSLNDAADADSVLTPSEAELTVPPSVAAAGGQLVVQYRARHPLIPSSPHGLQQTMLDAQEVALPRTHLRALLLFVASRAHMPTGMVNEYNAGNNYLAQYEAECALLDGMNLAVDMQRQPGHERFRRGGWK